MNEIYRRMRIRRGLSQQDLAIRSGIAQPAISQFEAGKQNFSEKRLSRLDAVLEAYPPLETPEIRRKVEGLTQEGIASRLGLTRAIVRKCMGYKPPVRVLDL